MYETERQSWFNLPLQNPVKGEGNAGKQVFKPYTNTLNLGLPFISLHNHQAALFCCIYVAWHPYLF